MKIVFTKQKNGCEICVRSSHPQEVPWRRGSATPHKAADEDGAKLA